TGSPISARDDSFSFWESEAAAELVTRWFGRSLTLPSNEWFGNVRDNGCVLAPPLLAMLLFAIALQSHKRVNFFSESVFFGYTAH
ncbi:MAG: hypothetical protein ACOVLE_06395, partial [Pirellula staleyi]